jgi:hypothetical protein
MPAEGKLVPDVISITSSSFPSWSVVIPIYTPRRAVPIFRSDISYAACVSGSFLTSRATLEAYLEFLVTRPYRDQHRSSSKPYHSQLFPGVQ